MGLSLPLLWAVHIADGMLSPVWLLAGFVVAGALALLASCRVRDEEIPRIALLSAAFFVASSIHVNIGPSSAHLLLNGLVGIILGWRAPLAILLGISLQAILIQHGGLWTIGVNTCTEALPALLAWWSAKRQVDVPPSRRPPPQRRLSPSSNLARSRLSI